MSSIVETLYADHVNIAQVIGIAEQALTSLEAGETIDYSLLEDIMRYMTGYPDTHHHPLEDVVFDRLKNRSPDLAPELDAIVSEHERIISMGRRFLAAVEAAEEDAMLERGKMVALGRDYVSLLTKHMDIEEGKFFPAAEASLTDSDWDSVREQFEHRPDPLFGGSLEEEYGRLWKLIQLHKPQQGA